MLLMLKSRLSRRRSPPARPPPLPKHQNSDSGAMVGFNNWLSICKFNRQHVKTFRKAIFVTEVAKMLKVIY